MQLIDDYTFKIEDEPKKEDKQDYNPKNEGWYEVYINDIVEDVSINGFCYLNFDFKIRDDVQQKYQNGRCFKRLFKNKETKQYSTKFLSWLARSCKIEGETSLSNLLDTLKGKFLKIYISHRSYQDKIYEEIINFAPSNFTASSDSVKIQNNIENTLKELESEDNEELPF